MSATTSNVLSLPRTVDECHAKDRNICAELIVGTNTVNQQIHLHDSGCTPIKNAVDVTAINVFDCSCGIWNAADETACNNGDDKVVDQLSNCAGLKTAKERGWKYTPTHISCYRQV
ncbi:Nn.00g019710.m01.CDS01 [Neocucurbitaria sp. VM-36]